MTADSSSNHVDNHHDKTGGASPPIIGTHPNGRPMRELSELVRPKRDDSQLEKIVFPSTTVGQLLQGIVRSFPIKQEYRMGWAQKSACDDSVLNSHPIESVAAHHWGVSWLILTISSTEDFQKELPDFNRLSAIEMALTHDMPEVIVGDITPRDGISPETKHQLESKAIDSLISFYPEETRKLLRDIYARYEDRHCQESKFVKDCDRLDFMIYAFVLERQGFSGIDEFYFNSKREEFSTKIARDMAELLTEVRNSLVEKQMMYRKD